VVEGREILTSLRVGDKILSVKPLSGSDLPPLAQVKDEAKRVKSKE
jgi:hypothetical protein